MDMDADQIPNWQMRGLIIPNIAMAFGLYLRAHKIGRAGISVDYRLPNEETLLTPALSVSCDLDRPIVEVGYAPFMPDLAVEIKSPDNTITDMRDKAHYYLAHGSRLVWLVFPEKKIVEVYSNNEEQILKEEDALTGGDVLPGFSLAVRDVFDV